MRCSLFLSLPAVFWFVASGQAGEAKDNLPPNGSFEKLNEQGNPVGWHLPASRNIQVLEKDGNHWMRVANKTHIIMNFTAVLKLEPEWKALEVSALIKTSRIKLGTLLWATPRLALISKDANGKYVSKNRRDIAVKKDADWTTYRITVPIPEEVAVIEISPGLYKATGVIEVDDIGIKVVETRSAVQKGATAK